MSQLRTATGRHLAFDDMGSGPPLLLIPGQSGDRRGSFAWLANDLASQFRVVSMDNRDAGENEPETDYYDLTDLAADAVALLEGLGIERARVLGHSMGGKVALQMALDAPARVDRLVLVSSSLFASPGHRAGEPIPEPEEWWTDDPVERTTRGLPYIVGPSYREQLNEATVASIAALERNNRATWAGAMRHWAAAGPHDLTGALSRIHAPTLVIHGSADEIVPFDRAEALAAGIPDVQSFTLEGVGHLPWVERPDVVVSAIIDFLLDGARRADSPS
jgi:pimeloyl-ACP methyl ester carboxylesterase